MYLLNITIEDSFILKAFADHNSNVVQIIGLTINKLKNGGVRRKADYQDFLLSLKRFLKVLLHSVLRSPHCVVNGKINASINIAFVFCKILSIWSHPLKAPLFQYYFCFIMSYSSFSTLVSMLSPRQMA